MIELKLADTSVIIGLLRGNQEIEELVAEEDETLCSCFPVEYELYRGTKLARETEQGEKEVEALIDQLENLDANIESARKTAELKEKYPEISTFDLMIAGICITHNASIITKDSDFEDIEELEVEKI